MTALRRRGRSGAADHAADEGPFVSFTDLFIGILFLFLILVAALMLMHQQAVDEARSETQVHNVRAEQMEGQIEQMRARIDATARLDAEHPPFRLAIVYNSFQRPADSQAEWTYSRTVQVFRTPGGLCLNNVIMRNNLSLAWKPPVKADDIPTVRDQRFARMGVPCTLTASGERWSTSTETGGVRRVARDLYSGRSVLHKKDGDEAVELQYRILGVYDDSFR